MTVAIKSFVVKDANTIRDDILRTIRNGLIQRGILDPDVGPGTDYYVKATAVANEIAPLYANQQVKADEMMPDTATGAALWRIGRIFGLSPRPASQANGAVILVSSVNTFVPTGSQLLDAIGQRFQVSVGGSYGNGQRIPIASIDVGKTVNHLQNDALKWVNVPAYSDSKSLCDVGGLTGGANAEDDDTFRARIFGRLQNPPGTGNWNHVCGFGEAATPIVQKAWCYPGANGPSTCHGAVAGYATATSKSRQVDPVVMAALVSPYVLALMPEYVETTITTVTDVPTDISVGVTLPSAATSQPNGPGGGWLDGSPWPAVSGTGSTYAAVTAVTNGNVFTVNSPTPPTSNVSRIAFFDPTNWTLYRAKVLSYTGVGPYVITIDQPFPNIAAALALGGTGPLIFPDSVNAQIYIAALLAQMALMGPGEKTANTSVLSRGYRHPIPAQAWPYSLNATTLKAVSNSGNEVLDTNFYFRSTTTPAVPGAIANPPNILIPRNLGFYPI